MDDKAVREALDRLQCYGPPVDGYVGDVHTIRAHISAQAAMLAELREHCRQLSGDKFSDRNQAALKSRAETAERRCAELVAERDSAYERGVRDGYEIRHNEVLAALA